MQEFWEFLSARKKIKGRPPFDTVLRAKNNGRVVNLIRSEKEDE